MYTGDSEVLESDEVFLEFITEWHSAFVVEDADHLLKPRSSGNPTLHRFLNIADGIVSAHGKKIIFSTNLPGVRDIDDALVRPGRCFAHVYLEGLTVEQAVRLMNRLHERDPEVRAGARVSLNVNTKKTYSVAEVYGLVRNASVSPHGPGYSLDRISEQAAFGFAMKP